MFGKLPISALQEYCAKKNVERPKYETYEIPNDDGTKSFACTVEALGEIEEGVARSKKEAKHDAAARLIKKLKASHPDIDDIPHAKHQTVATTSDAVGDLRNLCLQHDHPMPQFEIIQQSGPSEAPEFTAECRVSTIVRHATSCTKKTAKQLAALQLIDIIQMAPASNYEELLVAKLDDVLLNEEAENKKKFKTYRELIESDIKIESGTKLSDRHMYFLKTDPAILAKGRDVLKKLYDSDKNHVYDLLNALEIKFKVNEIPAKGSTLVFVELISQFDVVFAESKEAIYPRILKYFEDMLY